MGSIVALVTEETQKTSWEERQRFQEQVRELDSTKSAYSKLRVIAISIGVLALALGLYVFWHRRETVMQIKAPNSPIQPSINVSPQVPPIDQRLRTEAERKEANTLLSLGVVDSYEAASKLDPLEGIIGIDKSVAEARSADTKELSTIQAARIEYLMNAEPLLDSSPGLRKYIREHNSFVIVASEKIDHAADGLKYWRKVYPLAEIGSAAANNPDWVPIITNCFLTCDESRKEVQAIQQKYGHQYGWSPSQGWYMLPGCAPCRYQNEGSK